MRLWDITECKSKRQKAHSWQKASLKYHQCTKMLLLWEARTWSRGAFYKATKCCKEGHIADACKGGMSCWPQGQKHLAEIPAEDDDMLILTTQWTGRQTPKLWLMSASTVQWRLTQERLCSAVLSVGCVATVSGKPMYGDNSVVPWTHTLVATRKLNQQNSSFQDYLLLTSEASCDLS